MTLQATERAKWRPTAACGGGQGLAPIHRRGHGIVNLHIFQASPLTESYEAGLTGHRSGSGPAENTTYLAVASDTFLVHALLPAYQ
jgi:hypothetical protein